MARQQIEVCQPAEKQLTLMYLTITFFFDPLHIRRVRWQPGRWQHVMQTLLVVGKPIHFP
jgi:hypothetical protein